MRRNDKHRRLWFTVPILGATWSVYLVDVTAFQAYMAGREGVCIFPLSMIMVDKNLADQRKPDVVFHELFHAVNNAISIEKSVKLSGPDEPEETLVSLQAPVLYAALQQAGMLKLPRIPKGW